MGIKKLNVFLDDNGALSYYNNLNNYVNSFKDNNYKSFNTREKKFIIGVDFLLYAHKYKYSCGSIYLGFLNQILYFLQNKVIPLYVIDGIAPDEKKTTISRNTRKNKLDDKLSELEEELSRANNLDEIIKIREKINKIKKNNIKITPIEIKNFIELISILKIPYVRAFGEADSLMSQLVKRNIVKTCLSEDMDLLVYGCKDVFKYSSKKIIKYNLNDILKTLNINYEMFVELSILFGCDYLKPIIKSTPNDIYKKYVDKDSSIFLKLTDDEIYHENFKNTKKIFMNFDEKFDYNIKIKLSKINYDDLLIFLNKNDLEISNSLKSNIQYINNLIKNRKI